MSPFERGALRGLLDAAEWGVLLGEVRRLINRPDHPAYVEHYFKGPDDPVWRVTSSDCADDAFRGPEAATEIAALRAALAELSEVTQ